MSPVNVTSASQVPRALQNIRNAGVTIVLIYADFCGHCHTFMPYFDGMSKTPGRTANMVKIEHSALDTFNDSLTKQFPSTTPLSAEGYPTLLAVGKNGQVISELPVVREKEPNTKMIRSVGNIVANMPKPVSVSSTTIKTPSTPPAKISSVVRADNDINREFEDDGKKYDTSSSKGVLPPVAESDISPLVGDIDTLSKRTLETLPEPSPRFVGGNGLYGALLNATYQLAPAAVLTGVASGVPKLLGKTKKFNRTKKQRTLKNQN